jgi:hypothetical protein
MKLTESRLKQIIREIIAELASNVGPDDVMRKSKPLKSPRGPDTSAKRASMVNIMKRGGPTEPNFRSRGGEVDTNIPNPQGINSKRYRELEYNVNYILDNAKNPKERATVKSKLKDLMRAAEKSATAQTFLDLIQQEAPELFGAMPKAPFLKESTLKQIIREEILAVISEVTTKREQLPDGRIKVIKSYGGKTGVGIAKNPNLANQKAQSELDKQLKAAPAPSPASAKAARMPQQKAAAGGAKMPNVVGKADQLGSDIEKFKRMIAQDGVISSDEKAKLDKLSKGVKSVKKQAAKPAPAGAKYDPNDRRSINAALKSGAISKDEWRKARRALARKLRKGKKQAKKPSGGYSGSMASTEGGRYSAGVYQSPIDGPEAAKAASDEAYADEADERMKPWWKRK